MATPTDSAADAASGAMSSDRGRPAEAVLLANLLNEGCSQEAAAAADRLTATSPATTELEPERVPLSDIPCTGFWLNEDELARWNRITNQCCWKWTNEDIAWYRSLTGKGIPRHLHMPKPHAPHECQYCDDWAQPPEDAAPAASASAASASASAASGALYQALREEHAGTRRARDQVYWDEVALRQLRAKPRSEWSRQERDWYKSVATAAMMNDYESENEGEEPPAQEAAEEEEAKEPQPPSQSSRKGGMHNNVVYVRWCQQDEKAENTRLYHRI